MKVYMLNPPFLPHFGREMRWQDTGRGGTLYYPIWLSYATGLLESEGHEIRMVDAPAWRWSKHNVIEDIKKFNPDVVVLETSFTSLNNDLNVAEAIKDNLENEVPIIMFGPPTSQFPNKILESKGVDIITRWEFDFTLAELLNKLENGEDIKDVLGISYKKDGEIIHKPDRPFSTSEDLDKLPFVSKAYKKHLNIRDYFLNYSLYPMVQIFVGRGCPFQCTFCAWPQTFMGRKYRVRSVDNLLDELEWIEKNLPEVKEVFFEDDTFPIRKKMVMEFCQKYNERGLKLHGRAIPVPIA